METNGVHLLPNGTRGYMTLAQSISPFLLLGAHPRPALASLSNTVVSQEHSPYRMHKLCGVHPERHEFPSLLEYDASIEACSLTFV